MKNKAKTSAGPAEGSDLVWRNERRKIGELVDWERNPRQMTEKQASDLAASLKRFGYVESIAVNLDGTIIGGHMRRRVLLAQAMIDPGVEIDVRVPSRALTPEEVEELAIRLNRNLGEWDWGALANTFDEESLLEWGFTEKDLKGDPEDGEAFTGDMPQATQLQPSREYVVIVCDLDDGTQFEQLRQALGLGMVRRGGYRKGSQFDAVGVERVLKASTLLEKLRCSSPSRPKGGRRSAKARSTSKDAA